MQMRQRLLFCLIALILSFFITRGLVAQPGFTDAFYHFNAANRLVSGQGMTDTYLWTYLAAPDSLPTTSHLYWMPLTSLTAALGMAIANAPGNYAAAQWPFTLMLAGLAYVGFWLGGRLGKSSRHAWMTGLLTLFSGFYTRFWGATDTFTPYAIIGALCLVFIGLGIVEANKRRSLVWFVLGGVMAGLGHLTRADGVLLLLVGWCVILWPFGKVMIRWPHRFGLMAVMTAAYLVTMLPWFLYNIERLGTPLPIGGTQSIWFTEYNDLFNYPADSSPAILLENGLGLMISSRWEAFVNNLSTFIAVEGLVVLMPLMLVGLWRRRGEAFLRGVWIYALGLHVAMTLVFPYPGYRGGLFHSAAALVPWWAALGVVGLDDAIEWAARRRRWNASTAKIVFSAALLMAALFLSLSTALPNRVGAGRSGLHDELAVKVPDGARVMINDPAQLYYFTGLGGVVLPNEVPEVIPDIARQYGVDYLLLEAVPEGETVTRAAPPKLWPILSETYDFLIPIPMDYPGARLYEIRY